MTKITDMLGQEVQVGDTIAAAFRCYHGTAPQMRIGTIVDITSRRSSERNGFPKGELRPLEEHLQVRWTGSSSTVVTKIAIGKRIADRNARGVATPHAIVVEYRETISEILVRLKRFVKIG